MTAPSKTSKPSTNEPVTIDAKTKIVMTPRALGWSLFSMMSLVLGGAYWAWGIGRDVDDMKGLVSQIATNLDTIAKSRVSESEFERWRELFAAKNPTLVVPRFVPE